MAKRGSTGRRLATTLVVLVWAVAVRGQDPEPKQPERRVLTLNEWKMVAHKIRSSEDLTIRKSERLRRAAEGVQVEVSKRLKDIRTWREVSTEHGSAKVEERGLVVETGGLDQWREFRVPTEDVDLVTGWGVGDVLTQRFELQVRGLDWTLGDRVADYPSRVAREEAPAILPVEWPKAEGTKEGWHKSTKGLSEAELKKHVRKARWLYWYTEATVVSQVYGYVQFEWADDYFKAKTAGLTPQVSDDLAAIRTGDRLVLAVCPDRVRLDKGGPVVVWEVRFSRHVPK